MHSCICFIFVNFIFLLVLDNQANVEILQDLILGQVEVQECQELLDSSLFLPVEHIEGTVLFTIYTCSFTSILINVFSTTRSFTYEIP